MTRFLFIITLIFFTIASFSQSVIGFGKFPTQQNDTTPIFTNDLLTKVNWQSLKSFCDTAKGYYTYERKDSLLTSYKYVSQGYEASFDIISYRGMVLEYHCDFTNTSQPSTSSYFDKNLWLMYVNEMMPELPEQYKLSITESQGVLKAYYQLLGINTRDEYGWICEYSTIGREPERRMAVIALLSYHRTDLLKKLVSYPNLQTQLYAIDALIYSDYEIKNKTKSTEMMLEHKQIELDSLRNLEQVDKNKIDAIRSEIKSSKERIKYLDSDKLTKDDWKIIFNLRDSKQIVKTCGNAGSYRIYQTPITELLSDKAIAEIMTNYQYYKDVGFLR